MASEFEPEANEGQAPQIEVGAPATDRIHTSAASDRKQKKPISPAMIAIIVIGLIVFVVRLVMIVAGIG